MSKLYTILKPSNSLYKKAQKRLQTVTFNCEICAIKYPTFTGKSIITKDTDSELIHVLNYCPTCDQRFAIRINFKENVVSLKSPDWDGKDEDRIYPRRRID